MTAKILDGKKLSEVILREVAEEIKKIKAHAGRVPGLAVILVGDDPASQIYVRRKQEACAEVGIQSTLHSLPSQTTQETLNKLIQSLNVDAMIDGILLQLPLPNTFEASTFIDLIDPRKDVDGFHPYNLGRLAARRPLLRPCTPLGIISLLSQTEVPLRGINAVVVGASNVVGRPMALELLNAEATVTLTHRLTKNLEAHVRNAELLIVAIGNPGVIKSEWIRPGAIVIDVGINRLTDGSVVGDIDFDSAKEQASWITPVPGGVGPMTVATLMLNTLTAYKG